MPRLAAWACLALASVVTPAFADPEPATPTVSAPTAPSPLVDLKPRPLGENRDPGLTKRQAADGSAGYRAETSAAGRDTASGLGSSIFRTGASLALVLGLILGLGVLARRCMGSKVGLAAALGPHAPSPTGLISVLGRYPIGRNQNLILLQLERRVLLLSQTGGGMGGLFALRGRAGGGNGGGLTTLCEITDPEQVASIIAKSHEADGQSLGARFRSLVRGFESGAKDDDGDQGWSGRHVDGLAATDHVTKPNDGVDSHRKVHRSADGDRVELWDGQGDLTPAPATMPASPALQLRGEIERSSATTASTGAPNPLHAVDALRRRLSSLRLAGAGGRACDT